MAAMMEALVLKRTAANDRCRSMVETDIAFDAVVVVVAGAAVGVGVDVAEN
jgi:hypothetical protein